MGKPEMLSGSELAFVGDAVYELMVRETIVGCERSAGELHSAAVAFVNANAQARSYAVIEPMLSDEESSIFKRGRNARVTTVPKGTDSTRYHIATGFEALFGYLYLKGKDGRLRELFDAVRSVLCNGGNQK